MPSTLLYTFKVTPSAPTSSGTVSVKLEATETENVYTAEYTFADVTSFVDADNASDNYAWITGGLISASVPYKSKI